MQLNTVQWISLPREVRLKLIEIFDIPRSSDTEVENNTVITDGYTHRDLATITVEKMQAYLLDTTEEDYFKLFHRVLGEIQIILDAEEAKKNPPIVINTNVEEITNETKETKQEQTTASKRVRTKSSDNKKESKS